MAYLEKTMVFGNRGKRFDAETERFSGRPSEFILALDAQGLEGYINSEPGSWCEGGTLRVYDGTGKRIYMKVFRKDGMVRYETRDAYGHILSSDRDEESARDDFRTFAEIMGQKPGCLRFVETTYGRDGVKSMRTIDEA